MSVPGPGAPVESGPSLAQRWRIQGPGVLLFLFIPLVLFLFTRHPEPVGGSLVLGLALMFGHRFLARPYMLRVADRKCLWSNAILPPAGEDEAVRNLRIEHRTGVQLARCRMRHGPSIDRFFEFVRRFRVPVALGIFGPLLFLLGSLAVAGFGGPAPLDVATHAFRGIVALTVQAVAWGYLLMPERPPTPLAETRAHRVAFPVHNFFLLGIGTLLWIFRLVGLWWTYDAARFFFA